MRWVAVAAAVFAFDAAADPAGLVSPGTPIARAGPQRTYFFFKDGLASVVVRPGFETKGADLGMLIAFPSAPAIRKVSDAIFPHLAGALEPPEVHVDLGAPPKAPAPGPAPKLPPAARPMPDVVKVLAHDAIGLSDVTTIEAGSPAALKAWMAARGFQFPTGMEAVCADYIAQGWVFVAAKLRVGGDGHLPAMGFRYLAQTPALPMRLAALNAGDRRQIVYLLTDRPARLDGVDTSFVRRQVPGWRLLKNLRQPLPIRVLGGNPADVPKSTLEGLRARRDPNPHNGEARALFASDLAAVAARQLALDHEAKEQELLRIGEALGLRGPELDQLHDAHLAPARDRETTAALPALEGFTLSVIDGEFPVDLVKQQDLTINRFAMKPTDNSRVLYDAKNDGAGYDQGGVRWEAP